MWEAGTSQCTKWAPTHCVFLKPGSISVKIMCKDTAEKPAEGQAWRRSRWMSTFIAIHLYSNCAYLTSHLSLFSCLFTFPWETPLPVLFCVLELYHGSLCSGPPTLPPLQSSTQNNYSSEQWALCPPCASRTPLSAGAAEIKIFLGFWKRNRFSL